MTTEFYGWKFPALEAPTARTLPERLSEIVNVKDWGAVGNNSTDDRAAIQAAIDYCISKGGGRVFFPSGPPVVSHAYIIGSPGLMVGSNDPNIGVQLVGHGGRGSTLLSGNFNGWLVSKGTRQYDNIELIEGFQITNTNNTDKTSGTIKVVKNVDGSGNVILRPVIIRECVIGGYQGVDASDANQCLIISCSGSGGVQPGINSDSLSPPPWVTPSQGSVWLWLGSGCSARDCRSVGQRFITYALSGTGASLISCSSETVTIVCRVGWAPGVGYAGAEAQAIGCTVMGLQTERSDTALDIYNARGGLFSTSALTGGTGTPGDAPIQSASWSAGTATVTTAAAHNIPVGPLTQADYPYPPGPPYALIVGIGTTSPSSSNNWSTGGWAFCTVTSSTTFTYPLAADPGPFNGTITAMSWSAGVTTVTISAISPAMGTNTRVKLAGTIPAAWAPSGGFLSIPVLASPAPTTTTFRYTGPTADPSGTPYVSGGTWELASSFWKYPLKYCIRCRVMSDSVIIGEQTTLQAGVASIDLDYAGQAVHSNNVVVNTLGNLSGWKMPTDARNRASWKFISCGAPTLTNNNTGTVPHPNGAITFAQLPGGSNYQPGPFEGQEYNISDGAKFGGGAAVWNDQVQGGSGGQYKVRYDGSVWRRIG